MSRANDSPTIIMPRSMRDEIDKRRPSTTSRSEWVREAIAARIEAEDAGEWGDREGGEESPAGA